MKMQIALMGLVSGGVVAGCGHTATGAQPHDMSRAGHEQAAQEEEAAAKRHEDEVDTSTALSTFPCDPGYEICWTDVGPTDFHLRRAEEHREAAAEHRAASEALRLAEEKACGGLSERDRDMSPLAHASDIASVSELRAKPASQDGVKAPPQRLVGATVVMRAVPGLTAQSLQRVVSCHVARAAAVGNEMPEMPYCPLMVAGVTAKVRPLDAAFAIDIRADDSDSAQEVWRRAQKLKATP